MRAVVAFALLSYPLILRADFRYDTKIKFTPGPSLKQATSNEKKPVISTHWFKGNRAATLSRDHAIVVDLDKQSILQIDLSKKTYFNTPFAEIKKILDPLAKTESHLQNTSKSTVRTKSMGFWRASEQVTSLSNPGDPRSASVEVDSWMLTMPGFAQVEGFQNKLVEKLGFVYASGLFDTGVAQPELVSVLEQLSKLSNPGDDMPVERTITVNGRDGMLAQINVTLSNFSDGPADDSKFNVPPGFKEQPKSRESKK